jgi:hypothetical protein
MAHTELVREGFCPHFVGCGAELAAVESGRTTAWMENLSAGWPQPPDVLSSLLSPYCLTPAVPAVSRVRLLRAKSLAGSAARRPS